MRLNVQFTWKLGGAGDEVTFSTSAYSADYLRDMWQRIERMTPGPERSALVRELVVTMDLFAYFQGEFVEEHERVVPPPPYLTRTEDAQGPADEVPPEAFSATESLLDDVPGQSGEWAAPAAREPRRGTQSRAVYDLISAAGPGGMTDDEIEQRLEGRHQAVSARRNELMKDGLIVDSGVKRRTSAGRDATVWVAAVGPRQRESAA